MSAYLKIKLSNFLIFLLLVGVIQWYQVQHYIRGQLQLSVKVTVRQSKSINIICGEVLTFTKDAWLSRLYNNNFGAPIFGFCESFWILLRSVFALMSTVWTLHLSVRKRHCENLPQVLFLIKHSLEDCSIQESPPNPIWKF